MKSPSSEVTFSPLHAGAVAWTRRAAAPCFGAAAATSGQPSYKHEYDDLNIYMCIYIYTHVYINIYIHVYIYIHIYIHIQMFVVCDIT